MASKVMVVLRFAFGRLREIHTDGRIEKQECFVIMFLLWWGPWLMLPFETFHSQVFNILKKCVGEFWFGFGLTCIGLIYLYAVLVERWHWRCICAVVSEFLFTGLGLLFIYADHTTLGLVTTAIPAVSAGCCHVRCASWLVENRRAQLRDGLVLINGKIIT